MKFQTPNSLIILIYLNSSKLIIFEIKIMSFLPIYIAECVKKIYKNNILIYPKKTANQIMNYL